MVKNMKVIPGIVLGLWGMATGIVALAGALTVLSASAVVGWIGLKLLSSTIDSINELELDKGKTFVDSMKSYTELIKAADVIGDSTLEKAAALLDKVAQSSAALTAARAAPAAREEPRAGGRGVGGEAQKPIELVIKINDVDWVRKVTIPGLNKVRG